MHLLAALLDPRVDQAGATLVDPNVVGNYLTLRLGLFDSRFVFILAAPSLMDELNLE